MKRGRSRQHLLGQRVGRLAFFEIEPGLFDLLGKQRLDGGKLRFGKADFRLPLCDRCLEVGLFQFRYDLPFGDGIANVGQQPLDLSGDAGPDADFGPDLRLDRSRG